MSEQPENAGHGVSGSPDRVHAGVRHGWWPGWIWAIPIAALLVVIWFGARSLLAGGTDITIRLTDAHNLKKENTDIVLRGTQVGHVTGIELTQDGTGVVVSASIDKDAAKFLTTGTRFWLRGANPSLSNLSSLGSLLSGPTIIMDPGPGKKARHFLGLERAPVDPSATERPLLYEISLDSEAGALAGGDPVTLRGFTVGEVRDVGFTYDPATGDLATPATLALYPSLFHVKGTRDAPTAAEVAGEIERLIRKGMRARLARDPPLVGSYRVSLQLVPGTQAQTGPLTGENGLPQIPVATGGDIASIVNRINKVPIERIAQNALDTTHNLATLTSSPKLKDAIVQLDAALKQIHGMTAKAGPQVPVLIKSLRRAAADLDGTAKSADHIMSGTATQNGVTNTVQEITEAARAVRSLADYLDRHPEALIRGRGENNP
ncbi:MAG TPA: MlaD family protein [Steroidobacteraceae bacterium]|nr:MlaD family protein [Steroidobacteraceae bacterium]